MEKRQETGDKRQETRDRRQETGDGRTLIDKRKYNYCKPLSPLSGAKKCSSFPQKIFLRT